jgi:hypothetical protein
LSMETSSVGSPAMFHSRTCVRTHMATKFIH